MSDFSEKQTVPVDVEKNAFDGPSAVEPGFYSGETNGFSQPATGRWARFDAYNRKLEQKLGIETRGIERVPETARPDKRLYGNLTIWLAANCVLPTFGVGILGPLLFYMSVADSMLTVFFFVIFSAMLPAFTSTFGPKLGLRQMTSSRFSWGFYGAKIVALLNCIACVGWSISNTIGGTQVLVAVSDWRMSDAVGVVIIALLTLVIGLFGYKFVHRFEQVAWIPTAITFFVLLGVSAKHLTSLPMPVGQAEAASVLSFGGIIFSFVVGWVSLASDYNVYMPADAKSWKVFMWTYIGITVPCVLIMWLGAAIAATSFIIEDWGDAYAEHELGGLVHAVLVPAMGGGGKFFMVLLVLSVVANNIVNVYSMGLSISVVSAWLAAVPRLVWPLVITAIYLPLSIVGANHFADTLEDFLSVLGYWLAIFVAVVLEEHFIFRKGKFENYNAAEAWNRKELLPHGFAAVVAFCFGVAGAVLGMAQVWYIGPVGAAVGGSADPYGGDIGFELSFAFTAVTFPPLRYLELKYFHR
ncbi:permease for cytosine/purines, uracil, thiamine, allantoin-domain-containing protein [Naematelia encephala]|uniref:Permease for cytosine/purines, uracil, thiamine, allantoin-domain-containing protein n=1 Tax=Naematelia encephala TaxID=71784 RepID=A0A1Y2B6A8_9TREE|nr:permease for cytosine/purines, uracil, thiamine, allantoin-domain-containing protein [Naematelia encephala]